MDSQVPMKLSAISQSILEAGAKTPTEALPREILQNLRYQHDWTDMRIHLVIPTANPPVIDVTVSSVSILSHKINSIYLLSGLPPRHSYIHPDFLNHLVQNNRDESDIQIQREWVVPMSTNEKWTLQKFCQVFDALPVRDTLEGAPGHRHQDVKRVLCGMKSHDGFGGDGTVVYYIVQEGEVKPRQN